MNKSIVLLGVGVLVLVLARSWGSGAEEQLPEAWRRLVQTEGQFYPIPEAWLSTPEGKIAHSLKLPDSLPKPVPFDFDEADGPWYWPKKDREVAVAYFRHLCRTEAGEWTFRKVGKVDGLYFARPKGDLSDDYLGNVYGPEAPWVEREFQLMGEGPRWRGGQFVSPPFRQYQFVEEPRRDVKWQADIDEPYVRLFGLTTGVFVKPGQRVERLNEVTPMQAIGIPAPTAKYSYTWRGVTRPRDREFRIAGGELIIFDRFTQEVVSVSRSFQLTRSHPRRPFGATWLISPVCREGIDIREGLYLSAYAQRVLPDRE